jgi:hypothetical protein
MLIRSRAWGFIRSGLNNHYGIRPGDLPTGGDHDPLGAGTFTLPGDADVEMCARQVTLPDDPLTIYANGAYVWGPIVSPPDSWTAELWYHRPGEATVLEAAGSPFTVTGGAASETFTATLDAGFAVQATHAVLVDTGYAVAAQHTASLAAAYGVEAQHTATLAAGYSVGAIHAVALDAAYAIRASQLAALAAAYSVRASHFATLAAGYDVESPAGTYTATLAAGFAVAAQHTATLSAAFGVSEAHGATLSAGYAVRASHSAALAVGYAIAGSHTATLDAGYAIAYGAGSADPEAVWEGFALEAGLTPGAMLRIVMAAVAGRTEGIGTATERYFSADGTKPRITATFDSLGNRTTVVLDGTP